MFQNMTPVVKQLLIINVIFYVMSNLMPHSYDWFALYYFESPKFKIWQLITHLFMHAEVPNLMHIVFNMFALVSFGTALEHYWGGKKFLLFYISCGLGAALLHMGVTYYTVHTEIATITNHIFTDSDISTVLKTNISDGNSLYLKPMIDNNMELFNKIKDPLFDGQAFLNSISKAYVPAVGASGAIYGLLVAFAFMFPLAELMMFLIPVPIKAKYFVPIIVAMDLFSGVTGFSIFSGGNIAHFAHVGGAITGFLFMMAWKNNKFKQNRWN